MKKYLFVMLVGFTVSIATACSNPSAPSASKGTQTTATPVAATGDGGSAAPQAGSDGSSTPVPNTAIAVVGPRGAAPGCLAAAALPDVVEWRVTNVPANARIDRGYGHEDSIGCDATERSLRTQNDHLRYLRDPGDPTTLIVRFDKNTFSCGHSQVDISIDGVNVLGEVVNYGDDCKPAECVGAACDPPPPPCTVTNTCTPPPLDDCRTSVINPAVHGGVATFTVLPGRNAELSFVSFKKDGLHFLPQKFFARVTGVFGAGPHTLNVPIVALFQADLFCAAYPEGEDLTEANFNYWDARVLAYDYTPDVSNQTEQRMFKHAR